MGRRHRRPPVPSSPRGRGLVEPYRPLGPLPPRTVRAVARLGPRPVADGHLVDVAALAAPPYELAAYGLHAGGLQAPVHARVPHGRYAGIRGGQVVVAGEHLATRAVRAARVRLAPARSVHYEAGPLVALLALPPDALAGVGDHVGRLQVAVALLVPLPRDLGMRRPQVVVAFQHLAVAAVGATAVGAAGPVVGGYLPCVPTPASPPDPPRAAGDDAVGPQVAVAIPIPLSHELRIRSSQVVETAQQLAVLAVRAAVVNAHGAHAHLLAPQVKVDPLVECDGVTVATRLPIAGEAGLDQQPLALVVVVGRNLGRQCGTRAHDAHIRAQYIDELGQLVERQFAQPLAHAGDARVLGDLEYRAGLLVELPELGEPVLGVHAHAAELQHPEGSAVLAHSLLAEEHGAFRIVDLDENRDDGVQPAKHNEHRRTENDVERTFKKAVRHPVLDAGNRHTPKLLLEAPGALGAFN